MTADELIERLQVLVVEYGGGLSVHRFCQLVGIGDNQIYRRFPGGWRELRIAAGLEPRAGAPRSCSDEELLRHFTDLWGQLGHRPKWAELDRHGKASASTYQRRFGSMDRLTDAAGRAWRPPGVLDEEMEELLELNRKLRDEHFPPEAIEGSLMSVEESRSATNLPGSRSEPPLLHVALYQPDIPQNAGNIGRSCVAVGAKLWFIRPLGFRIDDRHLKRAGMDYWQHLDWEAVESWDELRERLPDARVWCIEESGTRPVWEADFLTGDLLLFGSESRGIPKRILNLDPARNLFLPMHAEVRSLNLASTANTVMYEAVRQFGGLPARTSS